jgi:hypothetical protein
VSTPGARRAVAAAPTAVIALAFALAGLGGCATLFAGGPDRVPVATNPPGAFVYLNGRFVGQSPTVVEMDREHPGQIQIYLPGFRPLVMSRHKSLNLWFIANILWAAAIVPVIVDIATGNYQEYEGSPIAVGLTPDAGPPPMWYRQPGAPLPPPQQQPQPQPQPYPQPEPYPPAPNPQQPGPYQPLPPPVAPPPVH